MIGIESVSSYLPQLRNDNTKRMEQFNLSEDFIDTKLGFRQVARKETNDDASDLGVKAVQALQRKHGFDESKIQALVVVTQNPDGHGLPHMSAVLHEKLGLPETCAAFDISLGCSGWVYGLSVAKAFMEANKFDCGLLVTADPYSKVLNEDDKDTALIFGDGASATLLSNKPVWNVGAFEFGTRGTENKAIRVAETGYLTMAGRAVFNFSALGVPGAIERMLERNEITIDSVDRVILHQGSRYIVDTIAKRIGASEKTPFFAAEYGNTVSSSIPIILADQLPETDRLIAVAGFGVGLSYACTVLEKK